MRKTLLLAAPVVAMAGFVWAAQEKGGQEPQMPKPSKEHEALQGGVGTWDCVMKFKPGPDQPEMEAKGTETVVSLGGWWTVFDVKFPSMMMGMPWAGHGTVGYDPLKKKYIGTFIHSAGPYLHIGEGSMDASGKVLTMNWEGIDDHTGKPGKMREVFEMVDKDNMKMTMYSTGPDGKEMPHFTSTYTRKK